MANISFRLIEVKYKQKTESFTDAIVITGEITNNFDNEIIIEKPTVIKPKKAYQAHYWNIGSYSGGILNSGITQKLSFVYPSSEFGQLNTGDKIMFEYEHENKKEKYTFTVNHSDSSDCYIVTYCYGRESIEYLQMIAFRNDILSKYLIGRSIIAGYYRLSPAVIKLWPHSKLIIKFLKRIISVVLFLTKNIGIHRKNDNSG
jgi:hypothetical protein